MIPSSSCGKGQDVFIKVTFQPDPHSGSVISIKEGGVWIESLELIKAIQDTLPPNRQFLQDERNLFIPYAQIEWMASAKAF